MRLVALPLIQFLRIMLNFDKKNNFMHNFSIIKTLHLYDLQTLYS